MKYRKIMDSILKQYESVFVLNSFLRVKQVYRLILVNGM